MSNASGSITRLILFLTSPNKGGRRPMSNAYPTRNVVMANLVMKVSFTGRDRVAPSCQWLDPQAQSVYCVLKHAEGGAGRPIGHARRQTPTRLTAASNP